MNLFLRRVGVLSFLFFSVQAFAADIKKNITVNFVTEANYYPFEFLDDSETIQGFDIDIANAICDVSNLDCNFSSQSFDSLLLTLQFGRFDAVIAALDITEERKVRVDFSDSYYQSPPVFISTNNVDEKFSIIGKFIGVQSGSSNHSYLLKNAKQNSFIISYLSSSEAFLDLKDGKIDAVFADQAVIDDFLLKDENKTNFSIKQTEEVFLEHFSEGYGIAVKKGNSLLLERLNYGLQVIQNNGQYEEIFNRYFSH